jgi:hypothetical protein
LARKHSETYCGLRRFKSQASDLDRHAVALSKGGFINGIDDFLARKHRRPFC